MGTETGEQRQYNTVLVLHKDETMFWDLKQ